MENSFDDSKIQSLLEFYFVFDNCALSKDFSDIFEAIQKHILDRYEELSERFKFSSYDKEIKIMLKKLARSDRKRFNISKSLPRKLASIIIKTLQNKGILEIEKSKEIKPKSSKHQKIKKELRRYQVQDKIHFKSNFARFWFRYCEPNLELLKDAKTDQVLDIIKNDFLLYCSLPFELASIKLLSHHLNIPSELISSYWNKKDEIDIFIDHEGFIIVGEVKYKDRKICKNVLNILKAKCQNADIKPNLIVLFSKSGFSNELLSLKDDKILLFGLEHFKEILWNS